MEAGETMVKKSCIAHGALARVEEDPDFDFDFDLDLEKSKTSR